jgi:thioredoxin reductase
VFAYSKRYGVVKIECRAIVLAMGCRERNRGNIGIPGTRPAGVFTAGLAQRLINIDGYIPGRRTVILGSGDIGLIMARRLTWVGVEVLGVVEIQGYPSGLTRNIVQCLNDFNIPLYLSHTVSEIRGQDRVTGVTVTPLEEGRMVPAKSFDLDCDTILLSVGLIPDNELSRKFGVNLNPETGGPFVDAGLMSSVPGVFACGNVLHVHDLVDYVSEESERCATFVVDYLTGAYHSQHQPIVSGANVKYVIPNKYLPGMTNRFYLRSLVVKNKAELVISLQGEPLKRKNLAHVQPSEMVSFLLDEQDLSPVSESAEKKLEVSIY